MGRLAIEGPDASALVQRATTNDAERLPPGGAQYSLLCNDAGGVVEDLLVYRIEDQWQLVVNAVNRPRVLAVLDGLRDSERLRATVHDLTFETALVGLQGPRSEEVLQPHVTESLAALGYYRSQSCRLVVGSEGRGAPLPVLVSRTGYTGDDGFELAVDAAAAADLWELLLEDPRVNPIGLGARDTLRLEAGMCLYGHELSEAVTPYEAGLGRVVRLGKGPFVGRDALEALSQGPPARRLVGLEFAPGAVPRAGCVVMRDGATVGEVASGTFSPTLRHPIATAFVRSDCAEVGQQLEVIIREAAVAAHVVSLPFVPHRTKAPGGTHSGEAQRPA
jgi:aminomethyltransferase